MDADAPRRVAPGIARLRLLADPGTRPEIVVVARRQRDVDRVSDPAVAVGPERRAVEGLAGLPGQSAGVVRRPYELLDLDDDVIPRAKTGATNGDGNQMTGLRGQRDARLSAVAPRLDARVDAEQEAADHQPQAGRDRNPLLRRARAEGKGGQGAGEDREHGEPEGAVACERVVAGHVPDEASGDREPGQDRTERRYRREQEACGSLHSLPNRQEPRHDGGPLSVFGRSTWLKVRRSCQLAESTLQKFR